MRTKQILAFPGSLGWKNFPCTRSLHPRGEAQSSSNLDSHMAIWLLLHEGYWLWNEVNLLNSYLKKMATILNTQCSHVVCDESCPSCVLWG